MSQIDEQPRLEWSHTDACSFLMSDPESDTYHASRCLLDQIVALEARETMLLDQGAKLEAENAELRSKNHELRDDELGTAKEVFRLKARLAWFEAALPHLLSAIEVYDDIEAVDAAREWLEQHPKP